MGSPQDRTLRSAAWRGMVIQMVEPSNINILAKELLAEFEIQSVQSMAMDRLIEASGAERGMILIFDENGNPLFRTARSLNKEDIDQPEFEVSRTLVERVRSGGKPIHLQNAFDETSLKDSESVNRLKVLSVICLPLQFKEKIFGAVYLDNRSVRGIFTEETFGFVTEFSEFLSLALYRSLDRKRTADHLEFLENELRAKFRFDAIIGSHPKIVEMLGRVSRIADTPATVLIQGETGTGKELVARAIHFNSSRRNRPFIPINCGALPENLLESELFGHVRGAFTGAVNEKQGWFERADGGTLFLDEIGDMPPPLQIKLLRVLQSGDFSRIGSTEIRHCDVRVVAAASRDLKPQVADGRFREELYYRLNVIDVFIPPLRERRCDIPLLARYFLDRYGNQYHKPLFRLSRDAEQALLSHDFPGNVRELENGIQRAVILSNGPVIEASDLPQAICRHDAQTGRMEHPAAFKEAKRRVLDSFEKGYIMDCLRTARGNIRLAAKCAGMDGKNFHVKMKKYGIDPASFKKRAS
jgi:Nif-specific regulatory protein